MIRIPSPRSKKRARIEIIPLIDIMFFLLATFVMVSLSMVRNQGIIIHLPVAATGTQQDHSDSIAITVDASGRYHWNLESVDFPTIVSRLQVLKLSQSDTRVIIKGDGQTPFASIVAVLDEARKVGISKVTIQTTPPTNN